MRKIGGAPSSGANASCGCRDRSCRPRWHASGPPTGFDQVIAVPLRRWACAWLAVLTLAQMLSSTMASAHGAWHRHRPAAQASAAPSTAVIWRHDHELEAMSADAHARLHARGERHIHAVIDASVVPVNLDAANDAIALLATVLAPGGGGMSPLRSGARHERASITPWAATSRSIAPPLKPPRR